MVDIIDMLDTTVLVDNVNIVDSIDKVIYAEDFWLIEVGRLVAGRHGGNCEQHSHGGQQRYMK